MSEHWIIQYHSGPNEFRAKKAEIAPGANEGLKQLMRDSMGCLFGRYPEHATKPQDTWLPPIVDSEQSVLGIWTLGFVNTGEQAAFVTAKAKRLMPEPAPWSPKLVATWLEVVAQAAEMDL